MNIGFGVTLGLGACAVLGALYQAVASARDAAHFPAPGRLVDVGTHRLHLQIMGETHDGPTVVLEAGLDSFSANWYWVQQELAASLRVVAYDRAGLGWSDTGTQPRDAHHSAIELHTALANAGVSGPFVVVGHSYGGLVVRAFADLYPDDVVGMVLVDASHPDQWVHIPAALRGRVPAAANHVFAVLAGLGLLRVFDVLTPQIARGLPDRQYAEMKAILALPRSSETGAQILAVWERLIRPQINSARSLGSLPLAVLSVTEQPLAGATLTALQAELPSLSSAGFQRTVDGATHESLISQREHAHVVADTIREVVAAARVRT